MPQLRDSGTRSLHDAHVATQSEMNGFARIFGVETEYGISVTGVERPVQAAQVAMTMFQPVVSRSRSTNAYLSNGSRLYLDVGSHPEYATAEAADPMDALVQDLAGERVMRRLAEQAQERLRASYGPQATIHVFKNNVDSAGHAFGCHENYLVRRYVPLEAIEQQLLPFLITRQLYTGAGRATPDGFQITQRADFLDEAVSSATTRSRPMVNTRDEPHADPDSFRRLHVIIGDSNRSQWATWMKLATTHLVLCVMEESFRSGAPSGFERYALADPAESNRKVSRFLDDVDAPLGLRAGISAGVSRESRTGLTALQIQRGYLEIVERFLHDHRASSLSLHRSPVQRIVADWRWALDALERYAGGGSGEDQTRALASLSSRVDWAAKKRLLDAMHRRDPKTQFAQLEQLELDYHDIANGHVYKSMVAHGRIGVLVDTDAVRHAVNNPPTDTRAALRGAFIQSALASGAQFSADWTHLTVTAPERHEVILLDPFVSRPTPEFERVMGALRKG